MNKIILTLFLLIININLYSDSGIYIKAFAGTNLTQDSDIEGSLLDFSVNSEASFKNGFVGSLAAGYMFSKLRAELEFSKRANDFNSFQTINNSLFGSSDGELNSTAIMLNSYYHFSFLPRINPYFGLGLGIIQEIESKFNLNNSLGDINFDTSSIAWQAILGAEFKLTSSLRVFGEGRFFSGPGPELSNSDLTFDLDYNNLSLGAGLIYKF